MSTSISLLETPVYWVSIASAFDRHDAMNRIFKDRGFKNTAQINGKVVDKKGKSSRQVQLEKSQYVAISHAVALQESGPIIILEDDCGVNENFQPVITDIPEDADAIYLGSSLWGVLNGKSQFKGTRLNVIDEKWDRPLNMLGIHAVLYLSERYKERTIDNLLSARHQNLCCDETIAADMKNYNIYSCAKPMFYQTDGHNESVTSTQIRSLMHLASES